LPVGLHILGEKASGDTISAQVIMIDVRLRRLKNLLSSAMDANDVLEKIDAPVEGQALAHA